MILMSNIFIENIDPNINYDNIKAKASLKICRKYKLYNYVK